MVLTSILIYTKVIPDPEGRCTTQYSTSGIQNNFVELNPTRDAQIDPLVLYWVVHRPSGSGITLISNIALDVLLGTALESS